MTAASKKSEGTGVPSLNCNGKRISKRQYALISGATFYREFQTGQRQRGQGLFRDSNFAGGPRMTRELADEKRQGLFVGRFVWKPYDYHTRIIGQGRKLGKFCLLVIF
jgi:hypothetical protein